MFSWQFMRSEIRYPLLKNNEESRFFITHYSSIKMGKKKGKGKKKKEVTPITDPEMLRMLGIPLDGTQLNLRLFYRELGHPISVAIKLTDLACVHDMISQFMKLTNAPPNTNYIFVGKLRKSHQSTIMLQYDGGKNLKDHLGVMDRDELTFIEANERMIRIYTKKRMENTLNKLLEDRTEKTSELIICRKNDGLPDTMVAIQDVIDGLTTQIKLYRSYVADPDLGLEKLGTFKLNGSSGAEDEDPNAGVPRVVKPFASLSVEEQQRLKNLLTEGLSIKRSNEEMLAAALAKAAGGGKKGKKKKKK